MTFKAEFQGKKMFLEYESICIIQSDFLPESSVKLLFVFMEKH